MHIREMLIGSSRKLNEYWSTTNSMNSCCDDFQVGCSWIPLLVWSTDFVLFNDGGCIKQDNADEAEWLLFRPMVPPPSAPLSFRSPGTKSNNIPQGHRQLSLRENHYKSIQSFIKLQCSVYLWTWSHRGMCQRVNQTKHKKGKHWKCQYIALHCSLCMAI